MRELGPLPRPVMYLDYKIIPDLHALNPRPTHTTETRFVFGSFAFTVGT